jgi:hypothetical protein
MQVDYAEEKMSRKKISKAGKLKEERSRICDIFDDLCSKYFSYLSSEYGLERIAAEKNSLACSVTFSNNRIGVQISFEMKDGGIFVMLIRLVDGKLPPYEIFIKPGTVVNHFDLEDIVDLEDPEAALEQKYADDSDPTIQELEDNLHRYAEALHKYGNDILSGDFSIFPELEEIVKRRIG